MTTTTVKRTSLCLTQETQRQLSDLSNIFGENPSQVMTRALQLLHFSLRFSNIQLPINEVKKCEPA
jgi:hypothetical protein